MVAMKHVQLKAERCEVLACCMFSNYPAGVDLMVQLDGNECTYRWDCMNRSQVTYSALDVAMILILLLS
jgi:hypothetical protein